MLAYHIRIGCPRLFAAKLMSPSLSTGLELRPGMVMVSFRLEVHSPMDVPPEVGDRIPAVTTAGQQVQASSARGIGTCFAWNKRAEMLIK